MKYHSREYHYLEEKNENSDKYLRTLEMILDYQSMEHKDFLIKIEKFITRNGNKIFIIAENSNVSKI